MTINSDRIRKAIIPVAGMATRFLPASKTIPKTLFPVLDTPIIQLLVNELYEAGIEEIALILSPNQEIIRKHFEKNEVFEETLRSKGKLKELEKLQRTEPPVHIHYFTQTSPLGDGHALLTAEEFLDDGESCLVIFGDELILNHGGATSTDQLLDYFAQVQSPIIGVQEVSDDLVPNYGIVEHAEDFSITSLKEKPKKSETHSNKAILGKYIINKQILELIKTSKPVSDDGEHRLIDGLISYMKTSPIYSHNLIGKRFDTGSKLGLILANLHYGLADEEIGGELARHISSL